MKKSAKWILAAGPVILILLQFFNPRLENPTPDPRRDLLGADPMPPAVAETLRGACYDCHSDQTKWPWYSHVAPISWWLVDHVKSGRRHLNFSDWPFDHPQWAARRWERIGDAVSEGDMPLTSYTWVHKVSRLSAAQRRQLVDWARQQSRQLRSENSKSE